MQVSSLLLVFIYITQVHNVESCAHFENYTIKNSNSLKIGN